jgi:serine/threonine protein kinase
VENTFTTSIIGVRFQQVRLPQKKNYFNPFLFFSLDAKNLIDHLLVVDRHKRMRAEEILLHPWIMSIGQSKPIRNSEDVKTILRLKYEIKVKEYTAENSGP